MDRFDLSLIRLLTIWLFEKQILSSITMIKIYVFESALKMKHITHNFFVCQINIFLFLTIIYILN